MRKDPPNHHHRWTRKEDSRLRALADESAPTRLIGLKVGRTPESIYARASARGVSLRPTNRSPYGTRGGRRR